MGSFPDRSVYVQPDVSMFRETKINYYYTKPRQGSLLQSILIRPIPYSYRFFVVVIFLTEGNDFIENTGSLARDFWVTMT